MQSKFNFLDQAECDETQANNVSQARNLTQQIAHAWVNYATVNKLKHKTNKRHEAHHTFISGVVAVLGEKTPMLISLCLASGRDLESIIERTQPR